MPQHGAQHSLGRHDHGGQGERGLRITLALTSIVLLAEVIGGWWFNSLALLSDAAHMGTDVFALMIALLAIRLSRRPADAKQTYGYVRGEALGAMINALLLLAVAGFIVWEAIERLLAPLPVTTVGMLGVAVLGLLVNLFGLYILGGSREQNLNLRAAYLEVLADAIGSVAVIVGALIMLATGWVLVDPIIAILIALWIAPRSLKLLASSLRVIMEGVPEHIELDQVRAALTGHPAIRDVHDLHIWSIESKVPALTAHLVVDLEQDSLDRLREDIADMLNTRFHIAHTTLQIEQRHCGGDPIHR